MISYWRRFFVRVMAFALLPLLIIPAGCGGGEGGAIKEIELSSLSSQDSLALYYPVPSTSPARIPPYEVRQDLSNVQGRRDAALPSALTRRLAENGFVVTLGNEKHIYDVYRGLSGSKFITVDALLHSFHVLCQYSLWEMEKEVFPEDLRDLVALLYDTMQRIWCGSQGKVEEAALSDLAFLGVAARLLEVEVDLPQEIQSEVEEELELISAHSGWAPSPIFGSREDYGLYEPRGRYAGDPRMEGYFKAMSWLGNMGFSPATGSSPAELARGRDMNLRAILLVGALHLGEADGEPALEVWDRIYQPSSFLMGSSEPLDVYTYTRLVEEVFGRRFSLSSLGDEMALDDFGRRALAECGVTESSFHLFVRHAVPESYIFEQLVSPRVQERPLPRGLDLPAALGSDRALDILDNVYGENKYEGYSEQMQALRREYSSAIDMSVKRSSVYWSWMDILEKMLEPCGDGYPLFMQGIAWQDRGLNTFLGSWVEARHQTADFVEQDQGAGAAPAGDAAKGYVEPRPEVYASLAATVDMMSRGFSERGLAATATERLQDLYQLLVSLKDMAEKELRNETLSEDEYQVIAGIGDTLRSLETFTVAEGDGPPRVAGTYMPLITGVYTNPDFGEALEAAVGKPCVCYVIAPVEGRPTLTVGAGYSYYETVDPADEQLSDEEWREMIEAGLAPIPPAWTSSFTPL
jgi:hypothetical protein